MYLLPRVVQRWAEGDGGMEIGMMIWGAASILVALGTAAVLGRLPATPERAVVRLADPDEEELAS